MFSANHPDVHEIEKAKKILKVKPKDNFILQLAIYFTASC